MVFLLVSKYRLWRVHSFSDRFDSSTFYRLGLHFGDVEDHLGYRLGLLELVADSFFGLVPVPAPLVDLDRRKFQLRSDFLDEPVRPVLLLDVEFEESTVLFVSFHHVLPLLRIVLHDLLAVLLRN